MLRSELDPSTTSPPSTKLPSLAKGERRTATNSTTPTQTISPTNGRIIVTKAMTDTPAMISAVGDFSLRSI